MTKFQLVALLFVLAAFTAFAGEIITRSDPHNIYICVDPSRPKQLIHEQTVKVGWKLWQVQKKSVVFPFGSVNNRSISCLSVLDKDQNGKGGFPVIHSGGIGYYEVQIDLTSQRSKGINFLVQIYADKSRN